MNVVTTLMSLFITISTVNIYLVILKHVIMKCIVANMLSISYNSFNSSIECTITLFSSHSLWIPYGRFAAVIFTCHSDRPLNHLRNARSKSQYQEILPFESLLSHLLPKDWGRNGPWGVSI